MFWKKKVSAEPPSSGTIPIMKPEPTTELDKALEGVADILRARARYAFSVGDEDASAVASAFERWAAHLLVRSPPPGEPTMKDPTARDWRGAVEFVRTRSKKEQEWAQGSVRDMREAIFALVESFSRTTYSQGRQETVLRRRLAGLNQAVETGSLEALKREARSVANAVTQVLEEQQLAARKQTEELRQRVVCLNEELEQTRREGETDPLTKIANRRLFDVMLTRALTVSTVMGSSLVLVMVDVDHFKAINDTHGHPAGDKVLQTLANALAKSFPRRSDLVARYGGEEFAIVLPDTGVRDAKMLVERLLATVRGLRIEVDGKLLSITVSAGIAETVAGQTGADLARRSDQALYEAKRTGRNRFVIAT